MKTPNKQSIAKSWHMAKDSRFHIKDWQRMRINRNGSVMPKPDGCIKHLYRSNIVRCFVAWFYIYHLQITGNERFEIARRLRKHKRLTRVAKYIKLI